MRFATSSGKKLESCLYVPTPRKFSEAIEIFKAYARERKFKKVVGGIRGPLDKNKTKTLDQLILKDWAGKPLVKTLEKTLKAPVVLENDADLAGLGEAVYGAGRGKHIVAYLTVGSGVGGVRVVDGQIDQSVYGFEPGKQIINFDSQKKTLEEYISGTAIKKRFKKEPREVSRKFYKDAAKILAVGLNNTILHWSPDIVVFGGGIMRDIDLALVRKHLRKISTFNTLPKLQKSQLGDLSGLYGALVLTRNLKV